VAVTPRTERKVCLLTGAGGTLGADFCRRYAERFQIVAVCGKRGVQASTQHRRFIDPLAPGGRGADPDDAVYEIHANLLRGEEIARTVELTLARFGRIDLIVNAIGRAKWASIVSSRTLTATADEQFQVNALVPLRVAAEVVDQFWRDWADENRRRNRCVVNVSSTSGLYVIPGRGQSVYGASKAALNMLSCHMADEFAPFGVRVNVLAPDSFPAVVATGAVAEAVVELADGELTGQILSLDRHGARMI